jgi:hypothetical protein
MSRIATAASFSTALILLVSALCPVVDALDNPFVPKRPTVDCDKKENAMCRECCAGGFECPESDPDDFKIFCCRNPDNCDVINAPPDAEQLVANIDLNLVTSGAQLVFKRKERLDRESGQRHFEITFQQRFRALGRQARFTVAAKLAGADAAVGSLLYAVAFLDRGLNALGALQALGYDVSLVGAPPALTCPAAFQEICTKLADQLSQGIGASLAVGTSGERKPFLQGLQALDDCPRCGSD